MGETARHCFTPGQTGKVLAAFSKAIYLLTDKGELFWIAPQNSPMHQRCAIISAFPPRLSTGTRFHVEDHRLNFAHALQIDIGDSLPWYPSQPGRVLEISQLAANIPSHFLDIDYSDAKGFGVFIPLILNFWQDTRTDGLTEFADPVFLFAQPLILSVAQACGEREMFHISQNATALIGLGPGLTPSGDDFAGGLLFAIKILQTAYPNLKLVNQTIPIEKYQSRTHLISFTLLQDLANGHGVAPLHQIMTGILRGDSFDSIDPFISQLTQIGNSTGWDLLAGLLAGLLVAYQDNNFIISLPLNQSTEA